MSLAGVLWGIKPNKHVVAIQIGKNPTPMLKRYAPSDWMDRVDLVISNYDYHTKYPDDCEPFGFILDPYYEAKALPYLKSGDLFWVVGIRPNI